jgi:eukaryotic-like serine/threonine-protein kinase
VWTRRGEAEDAQATLLSEITKPGSVFGSIEYMSPEQVRGEQVDTRTDLFSFGVVLYEMTTGKRPFAGGTAGAIFDSILHKAPTAPSRLNPAVPPKLEEIIHKLLEKDRTLRHQSASEIRTDLQLPKRDTDSSRSRALLRRSLWRYVTVVGTLAVLLPLVVSGLLLVRRSRNQEQASSPWVNHRRSVAVLGFRNLAGKTDEAWLSTAISEMLTTELSAGEELRTVPGETVAQMKNNLTLAEAESYAKETLHKIHAQTSADDAL